MSRDDCVNNRIMTELKRIEIIIDEKNDRFKILKSDKLQHLSVISYLADSITHIINESYMGDKIKLLDSLIEPMKQNLLNLNKEK